MTRFGVHVGPQQCTMDELRQVWQRTEELGFDWVSTWDHFYPSTQPPVGPCFEAVTTHAALATLTTRPRVGSLVYGAAYRHPAVFANAAVTIDHLSRGRLELGIGAGWHAEEHLAYGLPFGTPGERLRRMTETIEIVRALFEQETVDYDGEFFTLRDAHCDPKPLQAKPRIWVGASGDRALQLAGRLGDGWNLVFPTPEVFAEKLAVVREAAPRPDQLEVGVNIGLISGEGDEITTGLVQRFGPAAEAVRPATLVGSSDQMAEDVAHYVDAGAGWVVLALRAPFDLAALERFALEVMPRFRPDGEVADQRTGAVFGSQEWFGHLAAILTEEVAAAPELVGDATFCFQEVLKAVPPDDRTVAWHVRFEGGRITSLAFGDPIDHADISQVVDWASALPLARMQLADPGFEAAGKRLVEAGGYEIHGTVEQKLAISTVFERLHDRLALRTR